MYLVSIMPEIWLNYGITDVVLDIKAENLEQKIDSDGKIMDDSAITDKLNTCLLYTSPSPRDRTRSRMPSSA